jgi:hypothetical protein
VAGLVIGMVVWYIGAARGPGNPYGIAAATVSFPVLPLIEAGKAEPIDGFHRPIPVLENQCSASATGFLRHDPSHHRG